MPLKRPPPRFQTAGLLAIVAALGLVGSMLFAHPVRRLYEWIAAPDMRLPIDASQSKQKLPESE